MITSTRRHHARTRPATLAQTDERYILHITRVGMVRKSTHVLYVFYSIVLI